MQYLAPGVYPADFYLAESKERRIAGNLHFDPGQTPWAELTGELIPDVSWKMQKSGSMVGDRIDWNRSTRPTVHGQLTDGQIVTFLEALPILPNGVVSQAPQARQGSKVVLGPGPITISTGFNILELGLAGLASWAGGRRRRSPPQ